MGVGNRFAYGNISQGLFDRLAAAAGAFVNMLGDVEGPSNANKIKDFSLLKVTTLEHFNALAGTGNAAIDQAAFAAAIAACLAGTYNAIMLGAKTYSVTGGFNVPAGIRIFGQGCKSIVRLTADVECFIPKGEETWFDRFVIEGVGGGTNQIGIANAPVGSPAHAGFSRMRVTGMTFRNLATAAILTYQLPLQPPFIGPYAEDTRIEGCGIGFWYLGEYSTAVGFQIDSCGVGIEIEGGNQCFTSGSITNCGVGIQLDGGGGNDGHGVFSNVMNNHATGIAFKTTGALANGQIFNDCMFFAGNWTIGAGTQGLIFNRCQIDEATTTIGANAVVTYDGCLWNQAAAANLFVIDPTAKVTFTDTNRDLAGSFPVAMITQAQSGLRWTSVKRGTAAAAGGTFVATFTQGVDFADNAQARVKARVYMSQGASPLGKTAGLEAQCGVASKAGVTSFPAAIAGSANPTNSGGLLAVTPEWCDFNSGLGVASTADWTVGAGTLVLTVTNQDAADAAEVTVELDWEQAHA